MRRVIYLNHILRQKVKNSFLYQFHKAQRMEPKRNDWVSQVYKYIDELQIQMTEEQIGAMPNQMFKNLVKKQIYKFAFQYLEKRKKWA